MALTHIAFGFTDVHGKIRAGSLIGEALEPTEISAATDIAVPDFGVGNNPVCRIATDTTIWVVIGSAPDVEAEGAVVLPIMANTVVEFAVNRGDKVAVMLPAVA